MTNLERAQQLYDQVGQGQVLEAFDKHYAENVVMQEPNGTREGKEANRAYEVQFLESLEAFHNLEIKAMSEDANAGKVFIEVAMDVTFKGGDRVTMEQVAVQQWEDGRITHERFYYNA